MKLLVIVKRLSHPQVRRRLKIGLSVWGIAIILSVLFKLAYDVGYFKAQSLIDSRIASIPANKQVLTLEMAQRIVTGALKEDPSGPKTLVEQVVDNDQKLATIIFVDSNKQKKIGWIINLRLFFSGDLYNDQGYNLTTAIELQHINNGNR